MNKRLKYYTLIWAIFLVVFNAAVFMIRPLVSNQAACFDARFWVAWAFVTASFVGNLFCAYMALQEKNLQKLFYRLPLITVSFWGLIAVLVVGAGLMLIPGCPAWVAALACLIVTALTAVTVIKAKAAADEVEPIDSKIKTQTAFVKTLTVEAESLLARAATPEAKKACQRVYEALRYSDPMSDESLADAEKQMALKFDALSQAVAGGSAHIEALADELVVLAEDRNKKCKLSK